MVPTHLPKLPSPVLLLEQAGSQEPLPITRGDHRFQLGLGPPGPTGTSRTHQAAGTGMGRTGQDREGRAGLRHLPPAPPPPTLKPAILAQTALSGEAVLAPPSPDLVVLISVINLISSRRLVPGWGTGLPGALSVALVCIYLGCFWAFCRHWSAQGLGGHPGVLGAGLGPSGGCVRVFLWVQDQALTSGTPWWGSLGAGPCSAVPGVRVRQTGASGVPPPGGGCVWVGGDPGVQLRVPLVQDPVPPCSTPGWGYHGGKMCPPPPPLVGSSGCGMFTPHILVGFSQVWNVHTPPPPWAHLSAE